MDDLHAVERRRAGGAAALALLFYLFMGIGPDLPWGDGAIHARNVARMNVVASAHGHPFYVIAGRAFVSILPWGNLSWRLALFSAVSAAAAVGVVHLVVERITGSRYGAALAATALAVSHTFWLEASTVEVYALVALLFALFLLGTLEHLATGAPGRRRLAALAAGLALSTHPLGAALLPTLLLVACVRFDGPRRRFAPPPAREALLLAAAFAAGLAPYIAAAAREIAAGARLGDVLAASIGGSARGALSFAAGDLAGAAGRFVAFLAIQFPSPALALLVLGAWSWRRRAPALLATSLVGVSTAALAAPLGVKDQFVFLLPAWIAAAVIVGAGAAALAGAPFPSDRSAHLALAGTAAAVWLMPVFVYAAAPAAVRSADLERALDALRPAGSSATAPTLRVLPGRDDLAWYLWPPKRGAGARPFAERVLLGAETGAWVLADWAVLAPCLYLQEVEGVRPDVEVVEVSFGEQAEAARAASAAGRPVHLTTLEYGVFDIDGLKRRFEIAGDGPPWRLLPKEGVP